MRHLRSVSGANVRLNNLKKSINFCFTLNRSSKKFSENYSAQLQSAVQTYKHTSAFIGLALPYNRILLSLFIWPVSREENGQLDGELEEKHPEIITTAFLYKVST